MKPIITSTLLPADWDIPASLRNRLGNAAGRQRIILEEGHLLLVLHAPPGAEETGRRGRFFWRDLQGNWKTAPKAEHISNLSEHLNEFRAAIEQLEHDEDVAKGARDYFELLDRVTPIARTARHMYDTLQEARDAVREDRNLIVARDDANDLSRRADLLHADAKNALDFAVAWQAEQQAETSYQMSVATHRLNLLVAFFFPIATLMAIFGVGLRHGLEGWDQLYAPLPLAAVIGTGLLCGILLTAFIARPARRPQRDLRSDITKPRGKRAK
jgi:hypothetical protein